MAGWSVWEGRGPARGPQCPFRALRRGLGSGSVYETNSHVFLWVMAARSFQKDRGSQHRPPGARGLLPASIAVRCVELRTLWVGRGACMSVPWGGFPVESLSQLSSSPGTFRGGGGDPVSWVVGKGPGVPGAPGGRPPSPEELRSSRSAGELGCGHCQSNTSLCFLSHVENGETCKSLSWFRPPLSLLASHAQPLVNRGCTCPVCACMSVYRRDVLTAAVARNLPCDLLPSAQSGSRLVPEIRVLTAAWEQGLGGGS